MVTLTRREDWPEQLAAVVGCAQDRPYKIGEWDCARFSCACVEAMTGVDFWPEFGGYKTKRAALVKVARLGGGLGEAVANVTGLAPAAVVMARRGDLMLYRDPLGEDHLGICTGAHVAVLADSGLWHVPLLDSGLLNCWRVG